MDYLTAGLIVVISIVSYLTLREYWIYKAEVKIRELKGSGPGAKKELDIEGLFENLDTALTELQSQYADAKSKGATDEQLSAQKARIGQLEWAKNNEWWLKPLAPMAQKWADKLLKMF